VDHVFISLVLTRTPVQNVSAYWPGMCLSEQKFIQLLKECIFVNYE